MNPLTKKIYYIFAIIATFILINILFIVWKMYIDFMDILLLNGIIILILIGIQLGYISRIKGLIFRNKKNSIISLITLLMFIGILYVIHLDNVSRGKICPDSWHHGAAFGNASGYFDIDGKRQQPEYMFDLDWVRENCDINTSSYDKGLTNN